MSISITISTSMILVLTLILTMIMTMTTRMTSQEVEWAPVCWICFTKYEILTLVTKETNNASHKLQSFQLCSQMSKQTKKSYKLLDHINKPF